MALNKFKRAPGLFLASATEPSFRAKAYADYLEDCANAYCDLVAICSEAADDDYDPDVEQKTIAQRVNALLTKYDLDGRTSVCLNEGYTTLQPLLTGIMSASDNYANMDSDGGIYDATIHLTDAEGAVTDVIISAAEVADNIDSNLQSVVATAATLYASVCEKVSDRLSLFEGKMTTFFKNSYDVTSNVVTHAKTLLTNASASCEEICSSIMDSIQLAQLANDSSMTVSKTDLYQFTGASPAAAVDFSTAKTIVTSTAKAVANVVSNIAQSIWNKVVKPVFHWAKAKVTQLFENPYDVEVINAEDAAYSIDGWSWDRHSEYFYLADLNSYMGLVFTAWGWEPLPSQTKWKYAGQLLDSRNDSWYKYKFATGELIVHTIGCEIRPSEEIYPTAEDYNLTQFPYGVWTDITDFLAQGGRVDSFANFSCRCSVELKFKPYSINAKMLYKCIDNAFNQVSTINFYPSNGSFEATVSQDEYSELHDDFMNAMENAFSKFFESGECYVDVKTDNENELYNAFIDSMHYTDWILNVSNQLRTHTQYGAYSILRNIDVPQPSNYTGTVTNALFLQAASGWDMNTSTPGFSKPFTNSFTTGLFWSLYDQAAYKISNPADYPFLPYQKDKSDFEVCRFNIKTDAQNQNALTTFLTVTIIVAIVAAVAITSISVIKKIKRARYFKKAKFVGECDQSLWTAADPQLNAHQQRKYVRYKRKMETSSLFGSNLATAAGANVLQDLASTSNSSNGYDVLNKIDALIKGI